MLRKVISIICYVIAGFFLYSVNLLAFINLSFPPSENKPPLWVKFAIMGVVCIPGVVALVIGLAISRFRYWKRDVGIVFVSGAGVTAFIVFSIVCFYLSPEFKKLFPDNNLALFSDIITGPSCILLFSAVGIALIKISRREGPNHTLQPTTTCCR
jgi:4-amino-4-deoxy-L-arabinose transferase-like glycosyltransferase